MGIIPSWITVPQGQVLDFCYDNIIVVVKLEFRHRHNKATNVVVDARLETRTRKVVDHQLNFTRRHIARSEDPAEDKGEVYDVAHHKADILRA